MKYGQSQCNTEKLLDFGTFPLLFLKRYIFILNPITFTKLNAKGQNNSFNKYFACTILKSYIVISNFKEVLNAVFLDSKMTLCNCDCTLTADMELISNEIFGKYYLAKMHTGK